jgi:hypothetical protein
MTLSEIAMPYLLAAATPGAPPHGVGVDPLSDVGCDDEELGSIPCVLIPSGLNDQPLSSLHEQFRRAPTLMTMIPESRLRRAFLGANLISIHLDGRSWKRLRQFSLRLVGTCGGGTGHENRARGVT